MQYSPKLKKAMEEIKEILRKHDIAGVIHLHTPGFSEYLNHISPTYSCADINDLEGKFELKAKKVHFSNEAERLDKLTKTANMLNLLATSVGQSAMNLIEASELTDKTLNAEHGDLGHSSHTQQNN